MNIVAVVVGFPHSLYKKSSVVLWVCNLVRAFKFSQGECCRCFTVCVTPRQRMK